LKFYLSKPQKSMGNYRGNNKKGLVFHAKAKKKNYKEEKKLRKLYEAPHFSLMLVSFYRLFYSKDLGKIL